MKDYQKAVETEQGVALLGVRNFDPAEILDCGQAFRWQQGPDGVWQGVVKGRLCRLRMVEDTLFFQGASLEEFYLLWQDYFDLNRDYGALKERFFQDPAMARAIGFCPGMRVLRQDPWEALCSFILSQNNNIKRIRGLVERLCEGFGEPAPGGAGFPSPQRLAVLTLEDLAPVRAGFRAKYLLDAAKKVANGEICLPALSHMPLDEARALLQTIQGVGPKVAECALLYGCGRVECFPLDVWIKRVMAQFYPEGLPAFLLSHAGIAQQYLFHFIRHLEQEPLGEAVVN